MGLSCGGALASSLLGWLVGVADPLKMESEGCCWGNGVLRKWVLPDRNVHRCRAEPGLGMLAP